MCRKAHIIRKSNNRHFFYCNKLHKKFVLLLCFYSTTEDTKTASRNTVHFIAGNTKLQLLELPKVSGKTNNSPIRFFIVTATHNYTSLLRKPMLLAPDLAAAWNQGYCSLPLLASSFGEHHTLQMYNHWGCTLTLWCCQVQWASSGSVLRTSQESPCWLPTDELVWMG